MASSTKTPTSSIEKIPGKSDGSKIEKTKKRKAKGEIDDFGNGEEGIMRLCSFSMSRIRRIIKSEDTYSKLPQDVIFLVNKAMEMFIEQFCEEAYECWVQDDKKSIAYKHLSLAVSKGRRFDFLTDVVPEQLAAEEALELRKLVAIS